MNFKEKTDALNKQIKTIEGVYSSVIYLESDYFDEIVFPNKIKELIEKTVKLCSKWNYNSSNKQIFGSVEMNFPELMISRKKYLLNKPSFDIDFLKKTETYLFANLAYMHHVILEIDDLEYKLWLLLPNGNYYQMTITIDKYLEFLFLTRGMYLAEAYLCPDFPKKILLQNYSNFYSDMKLMFNLDSKDLPMCYHKDIIAEIEINYEDIIAQKLLKNNQDSTFSFSPSLETAKYERIREKWYLDVIELNIGTSLPNSYKHLVCNIGKNMFSFTNTTTDKFVSIKFLNCFFEVFQNKETSKFDQDANLYLYGEKGKVPAFNGIRLFAISQEYKFGMHILEKDNIEIVMIDSVENQRLVQMPKHLRTMDGFLNRLFETEGMFLLDEIPL